MTKAVRQRTTVQPGGIIHLAPTDLPAGTSVEVIVLVEEEDAMAPPSKAETQDSAPSTTDGWKGDEEIQQMFEEIEKGRAGDRGDDKTVVQKDRT